MVDSTINGGPRVGEFLNKKYLLKERDFMLGGYHTYLNFEELECDTDERFFFDLKLPTIKILFQSWRKKI